MGSRYRRSVLQAMAAGAVPLVAGCTDDAPSDDTGAWPGFTVERALWSFRESAPETDVERIVCRNCAGVQHPPTVADGVAYVPGQDVYGLDADDGTQRWRVETFVPSDGSPVVRGDDAYLPVGISNGTGARNGRLLAVGSDGERRWTYEDGWRDDASLYVLGVDPERVYVVPQLDHETSDTPVRAIDRSTGEVEWTARVSQAGCFGAVLDGRLVFGTSEKTVALDGETGERLWVHDEDPSYPTVIGDRVVIYGDGITALTPEGEVAWRQADADAYIPESDVVYVDGPNTPVRALDPVSGDERWRYEGDGDVDLAATDGATAYVTDDSDGSLRAVTEGEAEWQRPADHFGDAWIAGDGAVYGFRSVGERTIIASVSPSDGTELWRTTFDAEATRPTIADGVLYVGTTSGHVHAFPSESV